jgi:hypothetical protein
LICVLIAEHICEVENKTGKVENKFEEVENKYNLVENKYIEVENKPYLTTGPWYC